MTATEHWASGDLYEPYVGRWSRLVAGEFLAWLNAPPGLSWLDVGCGTGALTEAVATACEPARVTGVEPSAGFIGTARQRLATRDVDLRQGDARSLPFDAAAFDRAVSGLVLNFVPEPARAVTEMTRVVRPGGAVALYVWDYAGKMELMRHFWDAAAAIDTRAAELDEGKRFPICTPDALRRTFTAAGLADVQTRAIDVPTVFRDFDDYWTPFLGGQGPAPTYCVSLPEDMRVTLRERLRAMLPARSDGGIHLVARAWAVRGRRT